MYWNCKGFPRISDMNSLRITHALFLLSLASLESLGKAVFELPQQVVGVVDLLLLLLRFNFCLTRLRFLFKSGGKLVTEDCCSICNFLPNFVNCINCNNWLALERVDDRRPGIYIYNTILSMNLSIGFELYFADARRKLATKKLQQ